MHICGMYFDFLNKNLYLASLCVQPLFNMFVLYILIP